MRHLVVHLVVLFGLLASHALPSLSNASTIAGKSFRCTNDDLGGLGWKDASFSILGRFTSASALEATLDIAIPSRELCNIDDASFSAQYNPATGAWTGNNVSFRVSSDGYLTDFVYTHPGGSFGSCRITMDRLRISGDAQPWLHLLLSRHY